MSQVHRSGPFKQSNKGHNTGSHKSKGALKAESKGRPTSLKTITKAKHKLARHEKRNQVEQKKKHKVMVARTEKEMYTSANAPPLLTTIVSLSDEYPAEGIVRLLTECDGDATVTYSTRHVTHISVPRFRRRYAFITPDSGKLYEVLDSLKVSDLLILMWPMSGELDADAQLLLSAIQAHGTPTTMSITHGMSTLKGKAVEHARKSVHKLMAAHSFEPKTYETDTLANGLALLRAIGDGKKTRMTLQKRRAHMLVEAAEKTTVEDSKCTLVCQGYLRGGRGLDVNHAVHLPGYGDFLMNQIDIVTDDHPLVKEKKSSKITPPTVTTHSTASPELQWSLQTEVIPDPMDAEQTWPTPDELAGAKRQRLLEKSERKLKKKVPKGTSSYQAAWIVESDEEEESDAERDDDDTSDEELMSCQSDESSPDPAADILAAVDDSKSMKSGKSVRFDDTATMTSGDYDEGGDDIDAVALYRAQRQNDMFPDELDTPIDQAARTRFAKYRGLKSFRTSAWDPREDLPFDYARIYKFENFKRTRKRVLAEELQAGVKPGQYIRVHVKDVPVAVADSLIASLSTPFVMYGLLAHEQKMSVVNLAIRRHTTAEKRVIKNKGALVFHVGYRRYKASPIFSTHSSNDKHKMERYMPGCADTCIATIYAPIAYPPASVLVFQETASGAHRLVATGGVHSVNPDRVVTKRICLSGHPYKINQRGVVVRYMFFTPADIDWFKPVELYTKYGRRGHIKQSLGTHGHMKCIFDGAVNAQDVVLMNLYKRVFPRWTYEAVVLPPTITGESMATSVRHEDDEGDEEMDE